MATITKFEDLEVWQIARTLSLNIYSLTSKGDFTRDFKFRDQIRNAAGSVMDNIAEGFERDSRLEFVNFLGYAKGSAGEVRSQLHRAIDQHYISQAEFDETFAGYDKLSGQIAGFIIYLNKSLIKGQKFKDRQSK